MRSNFVFAVTVEMTETKEGEGAHSNVYECKVIRHLNKNDKYGVSALYMTSLVVVGSYLSRDLLALKIVRNKFGPSNSAIILRYQRSKAKRPKRPFVLVPIASIETSLDNWKEGANSFPGINSFIKKLNKHSAVNPTFYEKKHKRIPRQLLRN